MQINTTSDALDNLNKKLGGADIEIEPSTNKVDALKKIYKTLGGTDDVKGLSTVYQVLEKITEVAEGGGGGGGGDLIKINCEYNQDVGVYVLDKTYAELYDMCKAGKIVYFTVVTDEDFTTLDDSYAYAACNYTLSKLYKYNTAYRVYFNSSSSTYIDNNEVGAPSTLVFKCNNSEEFPIYYDCIGTNTPYLVGYNFPW